MTDQSLAFVQRCRRRFKFFASQCLKVRTKSGDIVPFVLNEAQELIHARLEQQKREKGFVRALILKGRQQGASTYIAARFYARTTLHGGINTYILSHEMASSDALFGIVDRYQKNNPIAPTVGTANVKELSFPLIDSSYTVATAGQRAGGRGRSLSQLHGSECGFWQNAADHFASSVQAVPLMPGTEVVLESTANGPGGEFYERWQDAEAGRGDYIPIFVPWFVSSEYQRDPGPNFVLEAEASAGRMSEVEYAETFGLTDAQMAWRRSKISELRSEDTFCQEYPSTAAEAWVSAGHEPFISPILVLRARKRKIEGNGPLIMGVDPASMGGDRFSIAARRGYEVQWIKHRTKIDAQEGIQWIKSLIDEHDPARVFIDAGGIGHAIVSGLKYMGPKYAERVRGVNFGGTAETKLARPKVPGPGNRRAEMWLRSRDWLEDPVGACVPDMDALQSDACAPRLKPKLSGDFILESKDEMKRRGVRSPDFWDSVALTFASLEFITKYTTPTATPRFGDIDTPRHAVVTPSFNSEPISGPGGWMI